jgi:hypothetical protein
MKINGNPFEKLSSTENNSQKLQVELNNTESPKRSKKRKKFSSAKKKKKKKRKRMKQQKEQNGKIMLNIVIEMKTSLREVSKVIIRLRLKQNKIISCQDL